MSVEKTGGSNSERAGAMAQTMTVKEATALATKKFVERGAINKMVQAFQEATKQKKPEK